MIYGCYSIYDRKALSYAPPFYAGTDGLAQRLVQDSLGPNSALSRHPLDFVVFRIGTFDDQTGAIAPIHPALHVTDVVSLLEKERQLEIFNQEQP